MYQTEAPETYRRDWRTALGALRKLLANGNDTTQVFIIMRALNGAATPDNYRRLLRTEAGSER